MGKGEQGTSLDEQSRVVEARLRYAGSEMQMRIEMARIEAAQIQLQVQVEKTRTAQAHLAVEKARNRGRQLDIELEYKQAAKTAAASTRDASRLVDPQGVPPTGYILRT